MASLQVYEPRYVVSGIKPFCLLTNLGVVSFTNNNKNILKVKA